MNKLKTAILMTIFLLASAQAHSMENEWTAKYYTFQSDQARLLPDGSNNCVKFISPSCRLAEEYDEEDLALEATFDVQNKEGALQTQILRVTYTHNRFALVDTGLLGYSTLGITTILASGLVTALNFRPSNWEQKTIDMCEQARATIARRMCQQ